jgi:endonuclease-3 related protein
MRHEDKLTRTSKGLYIIYKNLHKSFGPQHWWPGETPFEVMVGAILTQNTNWQNVERAIANLKKNKVLDPKKLSQLPHKKLAKMIRSAGYFNIKAKRLKNFLKFYLESYNADARKMRQADTQVLSNELLKVNGVGEETADSILLYALNKPVFVVDAYTKRIYSRHGFIAEDARYQAVKELFMKNLKNDVQLFNEYHALLVRLGKEYCLKSKPRCDSCPLSKQNHKYD